MKIGYGVEDSRHRALLRGLRARWCPDAELFEGRFRGTTGLSLRRELPRICTELGVKKCDFLVFLTDANDQDWQKVRSREAGRLPADVRDIAVYGVPARNVECWLRADSDYLAARLGIDATALRQVEDPKGMVEAALSGRTVPEQEECVAAIVAEAPLRIWLQIAPSFARFYEDARDVAQRAKRCEIPNERDL